MIQQHLSSRKYYTTNLKGRRAAARAGSKAPDDNYDDIDSTSEIDDSLNSFATSAIEARKENLADKNPVDKGVVGKNVTDKNVTGKNNFYFARSKV
jgi:hypothetical protein